MYQYAESGLTNVWLSNGFVVKQAAYGESVAITDVRGLHDVIGKAVAEKPSVLTGAEFGFLRKELGLSREKTDKIPMVNDRHLRGLYLEAKTGEADLMAAIDTINTSDRGLYKLHLEYVGEWRNQAKRCA
jgi:DNA-binding transcriptional regulator YiaG